MNNRPDVLVIGGGVIGVCAAYYLAEQGREVVLLEKGDIGSGASHGNAGLISDHAIPMAAPGVLSQGLRWLLDADSPFYIRPRPDPALIRWLWQFRSACRAEPMHRAIPVLLALARHSLALYEELAALPGVEFGFRQDGRIYLYRTEAGLAHAVEGVKLLGEHGVPARALSGDEVRALEPAVSSSVLGGVFHENYAHVTPGQLVEEVARLGAERGVEIRRNTEVIGLETAGKRITTVQSTRGIFQPEQVVLAAGIWATPLARQIGLRLPIQPAKGYSISARRPATGPAMPVQLSDAKVAVTPMGETLRFSSTLELSGMDWSINRRRLDASRQAMRDYLRGMDDLEELEIWRGHRPLTPDTLPIIERNRRYDNLILAVGHGMLGITQGPVTGKLVAQIVAGEQPLVELAPFKLERFA